MAYDDSEALQPNSTYSLGGYTFELKVQNVHEPGEPDVTSVFAICHSPDGTRETVPMDFPVGTTVESWSVEANETEATVYATIKKGEINPWGFPPFEPAIVSQVPYAPGGGWSFIYSEPVHAIKYQKTGDWYVAAAATQFSEDNMQHTILNAYTFTHLGQTVYLMRSNDNGCSGLPRAELDIMPLPEPYIAWQMIYGSFETEAEEALIARFAIDLAEAGGGPDGDWDEPGSDGPFSDQIYVEVTGASAGTHNASNIPQEAPEQFTYGSGGIGGNGGGGGAGASTVIIYDFASHRTSIDGPVENAIIREPGTGGPGGKGGKGGDGCILIFY